jgi:hypothetical protein
MSVTINTENNHMLIIMPFKHIPKTLSIEIRSPRNTSAVNVTIPTSLVALLIGVIIVSVAITASATNPSIPVTVDITPETLNLKSQGKWIQAKVLEYGDYFGYYDLGVEDIEDVELWVTGIDGAPVAHAIVLDWEPTKPTLSGIIALKLDKEDVTSGISNALSAEGVSPPVAVTLRLSFTANGITFEGEDTIRAISS